MDVDNGVWTEIAKLPADLYGGHTMMLNQQYFYLGGTVYDYLSAPKSTYMSLEFLPLIDGMLFY